MGPAAALVVVWMSVSATSATQPMGEQIEALDSAVLVAAAVARDLSVESGLANAEIPSTESSQIATPAFQAELKNWVDRIDELRARPRPESRRAPTPTAGFTSKTSHPVA